MMSATENNWPLGRIAKRRRSLPSVGGIESECAKQPTVQSIGSELGRYSQ